MMAYGDLYAQILACLSQGRVDGFTIFAEICNKYDIPQDDLDAASQKLVDHRALAYYVDRRVQGRIGHRAALELALVEKQGMQEDESRQRQDKIVDGVLGTIGRFERLILDEPTSPIDA
jgi:hypothetical protein